MEAAYSPRISQKVNGRQAYVRSESQNVLNETL